MWEVALGNVDLCVGDFWETAERRQLAPMSASLDVDIFSLVAKSAAVPKNTAYFFSAIFMPFDDRNVTRLHQHSASSFLGNPCIIC